MYGQRARTGGFGSVKASVIVALMLGLALGLVEAYRRNGEGARAMRAAKRLAASGNIGGDPGIVCGCILQRLRRGSPMVLFLLHSRPSRRTRTRKVETRSAFACGVDRLAQPQHLRQYKQHDLDCLPGRKRGNDAGRAKANQPPPFNAATTIILQTPLPANLPSFYFLSLFIT